VALVSHPIILSCLLGQRRSARGGKGSWGCDVHDFWEGLQGTKGHQISPNLSGSLRKGGSAEKEEKKGDARPPVQTPFPASARGGGGRPALAWLMPLF